MSKLPTGTVTFLFTDIEGSTPLWERMPAAMQASLEQHNQILHTAIAAQGGQVFKTIGDAFQAAFALPSQAVAAALAAQRTLAAAAWGETGPLKVRMGMHLGPGVVRGKDYAATHTLNRVARIMSAGHGGQMLLSLAMAELLRGQLPEGAALKDLGEHFLKGLSQREHIFQLLVPDLPGDFPPLVTKNVPRGYELREQIGAGGFGAVYRAFHPEVGREVAVKIVLPEFANHPDFIRRFEAEAQIIARLEHPRIVPLYDYWREPDSAYLVMRLLRGGSLQTLLEAGPLPLEKVANLVEQMAEALSAAHQLGIVHRDLKPANILLDEAGNYYLSDFGIAKDIALESQATLEGGLLGSPLYMSPEQMLSQPVTPQSDIYGLGVVLYEALTGEKPFPDESLAALIDKQLHTPLPAIHALRPELPPGVDAVIQRATAKDPAERFPDALALAAAFRQALAGVVTAAVEAVPSGEEEALLTNPYKGLRAFQESDAGDFYGREALVQALLARLGPDGKASLPEANGSGEGRFLAVVGPSGSGKSSVVKAGLIPALRQGAVPGSENWFIVEMLPGAHPLEELEATLLRVAVNPPASLLDQLSADERGLLRAAKRVLPGGEEAQLLLVIDQFEEVFTLVEDRAASKHLLDSLFAAVTDPRSPVRVAITLRADFYDRPLMYPDFSELMRQHTEVVVPLTAEELAQAIREPALQAGATLEAGLVTAIVAEVHEQPGALPLLQYSLTELFEHREGHTLTRAAYEQIGGVLGALSRRAEELYSGLDPDGQEAARQLFLRLVTLGEGVEDTRRRALRSELEAIRIAPPDEEPLAAMEAQDISSAFIHHPPSSVMGSVIDAFGRYRLLSFDRDPLTRGPTVEVAHEAILREWSRLRGWLDESREDIRQHRRLNSLANEWQQAGREPSFLLRGARLEQLEAWAAATTLALTPDEAAYLEACLAEREARRAEEAARQAHETALERRSRNFLRGLVAVFAVAALVAVVLSVFAFNQQRIARQNEAAALAARGEAEQIAKVQARQAQVSQSLALAAQSRLALRADNLDLALALAMEAVRIPDPPGQAQMALSEAAYAPGTIRLFLGHEAAVWSVAVSPDGRYGLSGDEAGMILLWDLESGELLRRLEGHTDMVTGLAFTPDGRQAVSASQDKTLIHWDLETGQVIRQISAHESGINTVTVSPDGLLAASGSGENYIDLPGIAEDNSVRLWDLHSGEEMRRFDIFSDGVTDISFTPDGRSLAIATMADGYLILDLETGKVLLRPGATEEGITGVAVSPDGETVLTAGARTNEVTRWDLQTGEIEGYMEERHNSTLHAVAVSPDSRRVLAGSIILTESDLETGGLLHRFNFGATAIAYRPDGVTALIGNLDHSVRLVSLASGAEIGRLPASVNWINGVAYSPDGQTALTNDVAALHRWDIETSKEIWSKVSPSNFWEIAYNPDGTQALTGEFGGIVSLWDAANGKLLKRLESDGSFEGHPSDDGVYDVAFHPGGKFALTGSGGEAKGDHLIYWDLESGKPVWLFDTFDVLGLAISPDGRTALSAEEDNSVNWWDLETGQLIRKLEGHTNIVWSVAFVDERTAISASDDGTLILWNLESGTALRRFLGHSEGIKEVVLSPDKHLALSASRDGSLILWDVQSGEPLRRYAGHADELMDVAWRLGGGEALSGARDGQAIRWRIDADLETFLDWVAHNRYVRPLTCDEREAYQVEPRCGSETATSAVEAGSTSTPAAASGAALLPPLPTPTPPVSAPSPAPATAAPAGIAAWGVNRGSLPSGGGQVWEYAGNVGDRLSIRVSADQPANRTWGSDRQQEGRLLDPTLAVYAPDGSLLAEADDLENGVATDAYLESLTLPQIGIYRIEVRSYRDQTAGGYRLILADPRPLVIHTGMEATAGLAIHPNGQKALVGVGKYGYPGTGAAAADNHILVLDLATGEVLRQLEGHTDTPVAIAISPDGGRAVSAGLDGQAILWDLESVSEIRRFEQAGQSFMGVRFHTDGATILTSSTDASLALWNLASGEVIHRFEGHADWIQELAISPDGKKAYSTSLDGTLRTWDLERGELIANYQPFATGLTGGLAVSPNGSSLLVGGGDPYVRDHQAFDVPNAVIALLDASTGETLSTLEGHTAVVNTVAFSPDGRYALSGSWDRTVRLWDVNSGEQLAVFTGHTNEIWQVAFSPDGLTGYSTSLDGSLRIWDLSEFINEN